MLPAFLPDPSSSFPSSAGHPDGECHARCHCRLDWRCKLRCSRSRCSSWSARAVATPLRSARAWVVVCASVSRSGAWSGPGQRCWCPRQAVCAATTWVLHTAVAAKEAVRESYLHPDQRVARADRNSNGNWTDSLGPPSVAQVSISSRCTKQSSRSPLRSANGECGAAWGNANDRRRGICAGVRERASGAPSSGVQCGSVEIARGYGCCFPHSSPLRVLVLALSRVFLQVGRHPGPAAAVLGGSRASAVQCSEQGCFVRRPAGALLLKSVV